MTAPPPTRLLATLRQISEALEARHVSWALVGGLAVSIRAEPRFTRDIDIAVSVVDDAGAETLVADLRATGFTLGLSLEQQALGRLATVRLIPSGEPEAGIVVDLLFASSGIEPEICRDAERLEIAAGLVVPVAQAGHLLVMKILARAPDRVQDEADARMLVRDLSDEDRVRARLAAARVETLGANRGRPIRDELERLLASE